MPWRIVPQKVKKSIVNVKLMAQYRRTDQQRKQLEAKYGHPFGPYGKIRDVSKLAVRVVIGNQRGNELQLKLTYNPTSGIWTLQHPSKLEHPPIKHDGKKVKKIKGQVVLDMLAEKIETPGPKERYESRREFDDRISRFTGPDFAAQVIALLTVAARELITNAKVSEADPR